MDTLRYSLSAADVHVVTVGDDIVGICHPCKIYGAMAVARPIFLIGPESCHASEIMNQDDIGWHVRHGDVDGAVDAIVAMSSSGRSKLREMGATSRRVVQAQFGKDSLVRQLCDVLERGVAAAESMSARRVAGEP
jgi:glycosyltransferase involved in cell wall biosynthesis